ncbi:prephenate dehydrogenase [Nonomuraea turkmeniaca]|uniref:Prephenate dehydrogenase n=1 Tax=Nonomuraea turkmeniaca TaxID=103838 RepID=A0A5S4F4N1_9ACTN|nr:prephenate dehydrogenase [Nonomuraea turkmeniaca]TMR10880.1 prephenate dehydrogenase [Nonomuraea turkmeniaca]
MAASGLHALASEQRAAAPALGRIVVIGTGLIGTSIALAMRQVGTEVLLIDRDPDAVRLAADLGAGTPWPDDSGEPADLAVVAVPPPAVAATLLDAQKRGVAAAYTDVASVKGPPLAEAMRLGCDLRVFVPGHPMGGRERSGPLAARPGLFLGRPWVLCPTQECDPAVVAGVTELVTGCGATPVTMDAAEHDRAVALISHAPHVVSAAMAARFTEAPQHMVNLAGQGARDVTRIAAADPELWLEILRANAHPVADVIESVARDLALTAAALRAEGGPADLARPVADLARPVADLGRPDADTARPVADLLARGTDGRGRIPAKHGGSPQPLATVTALVPDRPGELALIFQAAGVAGINIEDVTIDHLPGRSVGVVELAVDPDSAPLLAAELRTRGWSVPVTPTC